MKSLLKNKALTVAILATLATGTAKATVYNNDFGDTTTDFSGSNTGTAAIAVDTTTGVAVNGFKLKALENGKITIVDTANTSQLTHTNVAVNKEGFTTFAGNAINLVTPATYDVIDDSTIPSEIIASGGVIFEFDQADQFLQGLSFNYQKISSGYYRVAIFYTTDNSTNWNVLDGPIIKNIMNTNKSQPQTYAYTGTAIADVDAIRIAFWGNADNNVVGTIVDNVSLDISNIATNDDFFTISDGSSTVSGNVKSNDNNVDAIDATIVTGPTKNDGTFTLATDGSFTYTPIANFAGVDSFVYEIDGNEATAYITVEGLLLSYEMDELSDATVLADSSGNGRDSGTIADPINITLDGWALNFSDVDNTDGNTVMTGDVGVTAPTNTVTFCGWIKPSATSPNTEDHKGIFTAPDNSICFRYSDTDAATGMLSYIWQGYGNSSMVVTRGKWNFVAMTISPTNHVFYATTVQDEITGDFTLPVQIIDKTVGKKTISTFRIGRERDAGRTFHGSMKKMRVWNRTLSATELLDLYKAENSIILTPALGLQVVQTGSELSWTVEEEINIKEYRVVDAKTGEILETIVADGSESYNAIVPENTAVKLIVVDNRGSIQGFYPEDGSIVKTDYYLKKGWNLISMPGANADTSTLTSPIWGWNGKGYELVESPAAGQAVWVYSATTTEIAISAERVDPTIVLEPGWNLVGPTENMKIPAGAHTIYSWNETYQAIANEDATLLGGVGYWVFATE